MKELIQPPLHMVLQTPQIRKGKIFSHIIIYKQSVQSLTYVQPSVQPPHISCHSKNLSFSPQVRLDNLHIWLFGQNWSSTTNGRSVTLLSQWHCPNRNRTSERKRDCNATQHTFTPVLKKLTHIGVYLPQEVLTTWLLQPSEDTSSLLLVLSG